MRGDRTLWHWFRESRQSELVVILGEDFAALLGLALALIAVAADHAHRQPDVGRASARCAIGVVLIVVAVGIGNEIMALLIGQSAEPETVARLRASSSGRKAWRRSTACSRCSSARRSWWRSR